MSRYIEHVTLTTGHTRRSWRNEVSDDALRVARDLITTAREENIAPIPGIEPRLTLLRMDEWSRASEWAILGPSGACVVRLGIAEHSRSGAALWRRMHEHSSLPLATDPARCPPEPWCAARTDIGAVLIGPEAMMAIGDLERCIAWAWLEECI